MFKGNVLLTGGSGGIGRYIKKAFKQYNVYAPSSKELDLTIPIALDATFKVVIHAAIDMKDMDRSAQMLENVIDFANHKDCLLVYISSWVTLDGSILPLNSYVKHKRWAESTVKCDARRYIIVRPSLVIGRGLLWSNVFQHGALSLVPLRTNFVHVIDLCMEILKIVDESADGAHSSEHNIVGSPAWFFTAGYGQAALRTTLYVCGTACVIVAALRRRPRTTALMAGVVVLVVAVCLMYGRVVIPFRDASHDRPSHTKGYSLNFEVQTSDELTDIAHATDFDIRGSDLTSLFVAPPEFSAVSTVKLQKIIDFGEDTVLVESGITVENIQTYLEGRGRSLLCLPHYGGMTLAAAKRGFIHGSNQECDNISDQFVTCDENGIATLIRVRHVPLYKVKITHERLQDQNIAQLIEKHVNSNAVLTFISDSDTILWTYENVSHEEKTTYKNFMHLRRQSIGGLQPSQSRRMEAVGLPSQVYFTLPTVIGDIAKHIGFRGHEREIAILKADLHKFVPFIRPKADGMNYVRFTRSYIMYSTPDAIPEELKRLVRLCHKGKSSCE